MVIFKIANIYIEGARLASWASDLCGHIEPRA